VVVEAGSEIDPEDIPFQDDGSRPGDFLTEAGVRTRALALAGLDFHTARERLVGEFELQYLTELMSRSGSNMSKAAKLAGVDRTTLYRLFQKHGLHRDSAIRLG
jgi:DNA-binding NtrC family response regulator